MRVALLTRGGPSHFGRQHVSAASEDLLDCPAGSGAADGTLVLPGQRYEKTVRGRWSLLWRRPAFC